MHSSKTLVVSPKRRIFMSDAAYFPPARRISITIIDTYESREEWKAMQRKRFFAMLSAAALVVLITLTLAGSAVAEKFQILYKFTGGNDGSLPTASLVWDGVGNLYGTTYEGGAFKCGVVFKLMPTPEGSWKESVLYTFTGGTDGSWPVAELTFDPAGNLYGTTAGGGDFGLGTVFELVPNPDGSWTESVLHSFGAGSDGSGPFAGLSVDANGKLYGTTKVGGAFGAGTVFEIAPQPDGSWTESLIYSFTFKKDGGLPESRVILDASGNLYGFTLYQGGHGNGAVYRLTRNMDGSWTESTLYSFKGGRDGAGPFGAPTIDKSGNIYGTTEEGGYYGHGTVFMLKPRPDGSWKKHIIHSFGQDVGLPQTGLALDAAGNLYGTTTEGGGYFCGAAFRLRPGPDKSWKIAVIYKFSGRDQSHVKAGLILDAAGNVYGTAEGRDRGRGMVFEITP
jgi:uncharacterized repeat protein (TIGR03803 family)